MTGVMPAVRIRMGLILNSATFEFRSLFDLLRQVR
jgi:hypothetical protein